MDSKTLYVKNMVCNRCIQVVRDELGNLGIDVVYIQLGEVRLAQPASADLLLKVKKIFASRGFEILEDNKSKLIEQVKMAIIDLVHHSEKVVNQNMSDYLVERISKDYSYLSNLFSSVENITIEHYAILQKVELVKELLIYDELSLSEISYRMGYSSVQYLSSQFKKVTGMSPTEFKKLTKKVRSPLDQVADQ